MQLRQMHLHQQQHMLQQQHGLQQDRGREAGPSQAALHGGHLGWDEAASGQGVLNGRPPHQTFRQGMAGLEQLAAGALSLMPSTAAAAIDGRADGGFTSAPQSGMAGLPQASGGAFGSQFGDMFGEDGSSPGGMQHAQASVDTPYPQRPAAIGVPSSSLYGTSSADAASRSVMRSSPMSRRGQPAFAHPSPGQPIGSERLSSGRTVDSYIVEGASGYKCAMCDRAFREKAKLRRHVKRVHEGRRDHKCPTCGKGFKGSDDLRRHIRGVHQGVRRYTCPKCHWKFGQRSNLRRHVEAGGCGVGSVGAVIRDGVPPDDESYSPDAAGPEDPVN